MPASVRCRGTNSRYALSCKNMTCNPDQLCGKHRDQKHIVAMLDKAAEFDAAQSSMIGKAARDQLRLYRGREPHL